MLSKVKQQLKTNLINFPGWRTNRKIIVIESDDWGSIRMPSIEVYKKLSKISNEIKDNPYCQYDTLASEADLENLFTTLKKHKDKNGNHPVVTANTVVCNPNFKQIEQSGFQNYSYEKFTETIKKYYPSENIWSLWQEGMAEQIFHPQFHGREHLNVSLWLNLLQKKDKTVMSSFKENCWVIPKLNTSPKRNIQASYDIISDKEEEETVEAVNEGLKVFESIFNYKSKSFIANNFIWSKPIDKILCQNGVEFIQGMKYQKYPLKYNLNKRKLQRRHLGETNEFRQIYLVRNCVFEPSQQQNNNQVVNNCLAQIQNAFFWNKPAIITSHRLNFIGSLIESNRVKNLKMLDQLLKKIVNKWPSVEFMTSDQLGEIIKTNQA